MNRILSVLGLGIIIVSIALSSCKEDADSNCNVSNPAEELAWLKEAIDSVKDDEYSYYAMARYQWETVFYYGNCNHVVNYVSIIQNCGGDNIGNTFDLYDELTDITILWKLEDSKCSF